MAPQENAGPLDGHGRKIVMLGGSSGSEVFDIIDDPPTVRIYNLDAVEVDSVLVDAGETFTLIGHVTGASPFSYTWYQDGSLMATALAIWEHAISVPGTLPTKAVSWGAMKDLYSRP